MHFIHISAKIQLKNLKLALLVLSSGRQHSSAQACLHWLRPWSADASLGAILNCAWQWAVRWWFAIDVITNTDSRLSINSSSFSYL